jgi:hypothetical protein
MPLSGRAPPPQAGIANGSVADPNWTPKHSLGTERHRMMMFPLHCRPAALMTWGSGRLQRLKPQRRSPFGEFVQRLDS